MPAEIWAVGIILVVLLVLYSKSNPKKRRPASSGKGKPRDREQRKSSGVPAWLEERWERARALKSSGATENAEFDAWYFDEASERQLSRLESMDVRVKGGIWKGMASDLIGLGEPPEHEDARAFAKMFGLAVPKSQTEERMQRAQVFADPANLKKWEDRPASTEQKEKLRLIGKAIPKDLTAPQAEALLNEHAADDETPEAEQDRNDDLLMLFDDVLEVLSDKDDREMYEVARKPTPAQVRKAIESVAGDTSDLPDEDKVIEALLDANPALRANGH